MGDLYQMRMVIILNLNDKQRTFQEADGDQECWVMIIPKIIFFFAEYFFPRNQTPSWVGSYLLMTFGHIYLCLPLHQICINTDVNNSQSQG